MIFLGTPRSAGSAAAGLLLASLALGCAGHGAAGGRPPATGTGAPAPPVAESPGPIAAASDPEPGADRCTGYMLDGVALGMPRSKIEALLPLVAVPPSEALIEHARGPIYAFRAKRPGRFDYVQLAFAPDEEDPGVEYIRGRILVLPTDTWPNSLFKLLGPPRRAQISEWIWWELPCRSTLRLSRLEALGGGEGHAYLLEVRRTSAEERSQGGASVDMSTPPR